ncbi:hypothetical protein PVAND_016904 [Polypedilum vanderplanki]|uniref:Uncharacterized protein n=1 Tax=Polypedilum vanderplanki TaxID=319348 RepID=A0A9J6BGI8_POLVA|nr:hypothetical protein PVAND_016904 [Polypedilum vanderplanki]
MTKFNRRIPEILIFIVLITLTSAAIIDVSQQPRAVKINCIFTTNYQFGSQKNIYTCEVSGRLVVTRRDTVVTAIEGNHTLSRTNQDVLGIRADAGIINFIPKGIDTLFRNLRAILINFSKLKELRQENLRAFTKLKFLDLYENQIQYLEADLFKYNPDLELVWLSNNKIKFIHESVFENLRQLRSIYLTGNDCISTSIADNPSRIKDFLELVAAQCGSNSPNGKFAPKDPNKIEYDDNNNDDDDDLPNPDLEEAKSQIEILQDQLRRIEDEVFYLKRKRENALISLVKYEKENADLKDVQNSTMRKMNELQEKVKKMDSDGVGYIKQITGLKNDIRKQVDSADEMAKNFRNELAILNFSLLIEQDEIKKLRIENDRRLTENLELHNNYENLQEKKRERDMISMIVIFLLAFVLIGAIVPMIMKLVKERSCNGRKRTWNGFENVKMMNEEQVNVMN